MKIVIDTNVIISGLMFPGSIPNQAIKIAEQNNEILYSQETFLEIQRVLKKPKIVKIVIDKKVQEFYQNINELWKCVCPKKTINDCRDTKDNKFLEVAIEGNADVIITGDQDLLVLHPYHNIYILSPQDFLVSYQC